MNTFVQAVTKEKRSTTTENGMHAFKNSGSKLVDLFFSVGASRGKDISGKMLAALTEDKVLASQLMLWGRDVRGGAGEREQFRVFLNLLAEQVLVSPKDDSVFVAVLAKVSEVGRWDDLLCIKHHSVLEKYCFPLIKVGLEQQNQLLCKWLPRKGTIAVSENIGFFDQCGRDPDVCQAVGCH